MAALSVIICTHKPRADYLRRVLAALRAQTLPQDQWELLLIDNASPENLADQWDLSWHPLARHIREDELGLTPARLRGIAEATGEVLIFVDDDNVLSEDYLEQVFKIGQEYSFLGAWGGIIEAEFEVQPQDWMRPLLGNLSIRECSDPIWSNNPDDWRSQPCGAGLSVRRVVAKAYSQQLATEPNRRKLDRVGSELSSCGDYDLVQTSRDVGKGFGNFPQLLVTHLIPKGRVHPDYLIQLHQANTRWHIVLRYLRTKQLPPYPSTLKGTVRYGLTWISSGRRSAQIFHVSQRAVRLGIRTALKLDAVPRAGGRGDRFVDGAA